MLHGLESDLGRVKPVGGQREQSIKLWSAKLVAIQLRPSHCPVRILSHDMEFCLVSLHSRGRTANLRTPALADVTQLLRRALPP